MTTTGIQIDRVKRELLQALRGRRSQEQVSQRLGYGFNQVYRWESGKTRMGWSQFVEYCRVCHRPLAKALQFVGVEAVESRELVRGLVSTASRPSRLAAVVGVSRFTWSRWSTGRGEPTLDHVLRLIHVYFGLLPEFAARLLGEEKQLPVIQDELDRRARERRTLYATPEAGTVLAALELASYAKLRSHQDAWVAKAAGLDVADARASLQDLKRAGIIEAGDRGLYRVVRATHDTLTDWPGYQRLCMHWKARGMARIKSLTVAPVLTEVAGYRVFAVSAPALRRIRDLTLRYYHDVRRELDRDTGPAEFVRVLDVSILSPERK